MFVLIPHCPSDGKKNSSQKNHEMAWAGKQARVKTGMSYFPLMCSFHNAQASRVTGAKKHYLVFLQPLERKLI